MEVPFFHVISINTSVYVALDGVNTVVDKMAARRVNGNTDLMVAATAGDVAAVRTQLAKADYTDRAGLSPAALASQTEHKNMVVLLTRLSAEK